MSRRSVTVQPSTAIGGWVTCGAQLRHAPDGAAPLAYLAWPASRPAGPWRLLIAFPRMGGSAIHACMAARRDLARNDRNARVQLAWSGTPTGLRAATGSRADRRIPSAAFGGSGPTLWTFAPRAANASSVGLLAKAVTWTTPPSRCRLRPMSRAYASTRHLVMLGVPSGEAPGGAMPWGLGRCDARRRGCRHVRTPAPLADLSVGVCRGFG